ncbi:MAG TPA: hypothetical protein VJ343_00750, partial [archaeon]|nr:hypothetical protein [archaeon]
MDFRHYNRHHGNILNFYKAEIERVLKELKPTNIRLAVIGFLVAMGGISPVIITMANSFILDHAPSLWHYALFFFCFIFF